MEGVCVGRRHWKCQRATKVDVFGSGVFAGVVLSGGVVLGDGVIGDGVLDDGVLDDGVLGGVVLGGVLVGSVLRYGGGGRILCVASRFFEIVFFEPS